MRDAITELVSYNILMKPIIVFMCRMRISAKGEKFYFTVDVQNVVSNLMGLLFGRIINVF